jgi:hypothetical protein
VADVVGFIRSRDNAEPTAAPAPAEAAGSPDPA